MANLVKDLGAVSAYALAVKHGYKGTESEWIAAQEGAMVAAKESQEVANTKAPGILIDASGGIVRIDDGTATPVQSLVSQMAAVQAGSGDPAPDNVRTISGWGEVKVTRLGKNLVNIPDIENTQGSVIRGQAKAAFDAVPYKANTQYTFSADVEMTATDALFGIRVVYSDGSSKYHWLYNKGAQTSKSVTIGTEGTIATVEFTYDASRTTTVRNVQLEEGTVATKYEPYQSVTLTAATPQAVYGGSLNWNTGVLTVTHRVKTIRAADISYKYSGVSVNTSCFVTKTDESLATGNLTSVCSHFKNTLGDAYKDERARHGIFSDHATMTSKYFDWGEPDATVTDFGNWLEEQYAAETPVTVVYLLNEPYTLQLTPQQLDLLKGSNSLWSDSGNTSVTYIADTKMYIDNAIAAIAASIINA